MAEFGGVSSCVALTAWTLKIRVRLHVWGCYWAFCVLLLLILLPCMQPPTSVCHELWLCLPVCLRRSCMFLLVRLREERFRFVRSAAVTAGIRTLFEHDCCCCTLHGLPVIFPTYCWRSSPVISFESEIISPCPTLCSRAGRMSKPCPDSAGARTCSDPNPKALYEYLVSILS